VAAETVEVRLAGRLARYAPGGSAPGGGASRGDGPEALISALPGRSVAALAAEIGIPPHQPFVAVVNGRTCDSGQVLEAGDRVTLIPPIAGG
jgi:sulfur carrier protein ThiS